jgi:hypothetical protein
MKLTVNEWLARVVVEEPIVYPGRRLPRRDRHRCDYRGCGIQIQDHTVRCQRHKGKR